MQRLLSTVHRPMQASPMIASFGFEPPSVSGGWLVEESVLRLLLKLEIQKAQRLRYSVALVCLTAELASPGNGRHSLASVAASITPYLRRTDAVAPWTEGWLALLLLAAEPTHLPAILERLTARVAPIAWSAGGSCYPRTAARANDMLRQAVDLLARATAEGGNRLYVPS
jgi:hypothetical protein